MIVQERMKHDFKPEVNTPEKLLAALNKDEDGDADDELDYENDDDFEWDEVDPESFSQSHYSREETQIIFTEMAKPIWAWLISKGPNPTKLKERKIATVEFPDIFVIRDNHCAITERSIGNRHTLAHTEQLHLRDKRGNLMLVMEKGLKYYFSRATKNWQEALPTAEVFIIKPHICLRMDNGGTTLRTLIHELTHARGFKHRMIRGIWFSRYNTKDIWSEYVMNLIFPKVP